MPIGLDSLAAFTVTSLLLAYSPGPDNLFVLTQSALKGPWKGVVVTLGLCTGLVVHTTAVALGVAVIFQTSQLAFTMLKVTGALYLVYLAYGAWRAGAAPLSHEWAEPGEWGRLYLRGVVMNITNPKVAIFFLAFLPQFANPAQGDMAGQIMVLGAVFMAAALFAFSSIAIAAGYIRRLLLASDRAQIILNRVAAIVFVGLAVKLVTAQR